MTIPSSVLSENLRRDLTEKENLLNLVQNLGALRKFKVDLNDHIAKCKSWPVSDVTKDAFRKTMIGNFLQRIRLLKERGRIRLKIDLNTDFAKDNDQISEEIEAIIAICEGCVGVAPKKKLGMPGQMAGVLPRRHSMSPNWVPKGVNEKDGTDGPKGVNGERKRARENELTSGANGVLQRRPLGGLHQRRHSQTDELRDHQLVFWYKGQRIHINLKGIKNMQDTADVVKIVSQALKAVEAGQGGRNSADLEAAKKRAQDEANKVYGALTAAVAANEKLKNQLAAKQAELSAEIQKRKESQTVFLDKKTALDLQMKAVQTQADSLKQSLFQKEAELAALEESVLKLSGAKEDLKLSGEKEKLVSQQVAAGDGSKTVTLDKPGNSASVDRVDFALNRIAQQKQALIAEIQDLKDKEVANSNETQALKQEIVTLKNLLLQVTASLTKLNEENKKLYEQMLDSAVIPPLSMDQVKAFLPAFASFNLDSPSSGSPKSKSAANGGDGSSSPAGGVSPVHSPRVEPGSDRKDSPRAS